MQNLPYDAVIFDLDGTLTCSQDGILSSLRYALGKLEVQAPPDEALKQYIGPPLRETFIQVGGFTEEKADIAVAHYVDHFDREGVYLYSVFPYIRRILATLKQNNVYLGVATSKPIARTITLLKYFHLDYYFDKIVGEESNDAHIGKAELIRQALPKTYHSAAMVGDRKFDIEGAKANGIDSIGAGYGYGPDGELPAANPSCIVNTTQELLDVLCPGCKCQSGYFLSMEGMDGSGKSTQINLLEERLQVFGYEIVKTREPGGCKISESIRNLVLSTDNMEMSDSCEALLYAAARAQHVHEVIRPAVNAGKLVLCDRFVDSSIAFQGGGRELGIDEVTKINAFAIREMIPDATIYLKMDPLQALQRRKDASKLDRLESQPPEFYQRTRDAYDRLIKDTPERFISVDGGMAIDEVAEEIFTLVMARLKAAEDIQ